MKVTDERLVLQQAPERRLERVLDDQTSGSQRVVKRGEKPGQRQDLKFDGRGSQQSVIGANHFVLPAIELFDLHRRKGF